MIMEDDSSIRGPIGGAGTAKLVAASIDETMGHPKVSECASSSSFMRMLTAKSLLLFDLVGPGYHNHYRAD